MSRVDQGSRSMLLGRAVRILACRGIPLVIISKVGGSIDFEMDHVVVREIDVIVRAAMLDRRLFAECDSAIIANGQRAA